MAASLTLPVVTASFERLGPATPTSPIVLSVPHAGRDYPAALLERLRDGDPGVRRLLRIDPFAGEAPTGIRVRLFEYRYTTRQERRETGDWWVRTELGQLARL